ncbi:DUF2272 domain-containing protein [Tahibacter soli]|uniref:DUF2272 domain-containing protein n=1 Tax=Tahibacter soli TaxID=2983605 RepID=A0A9X3YH94_9GAMM|nr:DUF2272 domain-containing protein [Tahibacter soli]MDC8012339.1 DUF2272 domain-containing protein [Tahibacter soli]
MPATLQSIVESANREWAHWGASAWHVPENRKTIGHTDDEEAFAQHVLDAYCSVGGGSPTLLDIQDDRYFWSAVGMSAIMQGAGFRRAEFPFAQSHSVFIRHFVKARKTGDAGAAYWGFRLGEAGGQPDVGDIVACARGTNMTAPRAAALFDSTRSYESHSDVVVARRAREIDVVGANVLDSVTKKTLRLDSAGHIDDARHFWFAVLKRRTV